MGPDHTILCNYQFERLRRNYGYLNRAFLRQRSSSQYIRASVKILDEK